MIQNPRQEMDNNSMNRFQWFVVAICVLLYYSMIPHKTWIHLI